MFANEELTRIHNKPKTKTFRENALELGWDRHLPGTPSI
jgi:hypothetical protein